MPEALLVAKVSLLGLLATFLPLFSGVARRRAWLFAAMVGFFALLVASALPLVSRSHGGFAGNLVPLAAAGLTGLAVLAAVTWLVWRYPLAAVPAMILLMPVRVPIPVGGTPSYLLVPLYILTLAVAIAEVVVRDRLHLYAWFRRDPTRLALAVLTTFAGTSAMWAGLSYASHTKAFAGALVELFAFYLPFAVVYYVVYRYARTLADVKRLLATIIVYGAALAALGLVQSATRWVVFNRETITHDYELEHVFRANAVFWDPNMFGRFLLVVIVLAGVAALIPLERRWRVPLIAVAALAAAALVVTYSRSSWLALGAAAILFEFLWLGRRRGAIAVVATLVLLAGGLFAMQQVRDYRNLEQKVKLQTAWGWNKLTGGRLYLIDAGWRMFRRHPAAGVGLGGYPLAYKEFKVRRAVVSLNENHTTPVTVLAEEGLLGFAAYLALIVTYFTTALRSRALVEDRRLRLLQAGFMAVVLAMIVHSLFYNAFFEDPYLWTIMAMSMALTYVVARRPEQVTTTRHGDESGREPTADASGRDSSSMPEQAAAPVVQAGGPPSPAAGAGAG